MSQQFLLLADTQIVVWYLLDPGRLTEVARGAVAHSVDSGVPVAISAYSVLELVYAAEKQSNPFTAEDFAAVLRVFGDPQSPFEIVAMTAEIAARVLLVPREVNADPGDRTIIATAEVLSVPIVSSDRKFPSMTQQHVVW